MVYIDCEENVFRFFVFKSHTYKAIPNYRTKETVITSIEFPNTIKSVLKEGVWIYQ